MRTIFSRGGAAHDRVVDQHDALASSTARLGLCFMRTPELAHALVGWMKVRPTKWLRMMPEFVGQAAFLRSSRGCGHAGVGHRHDDVGGRGASCARRRPMRLRTS
jgi:hypothetical protein